MANIITNFKAISAALTDPTTNTADEVGAGTAPNRAGTDVGVDVIGLCDTITKSLFDLKYKLDELDRILPAGTAQTALTTFIGTDFFA
jgi:hypothetical protein